MMLAEIKNECQNHCAQLVTFQTYHTCDKALRNQLITAVEEQYIKELCQGIVGYSNCTTNEFLAHLYAHYGIITLSMLQESYTKMIQPYNPTMPIKKFFELLEAAQDLASVNGTGYTKAQLINIAFSLVFQQGVVNDTCQTWQHQPTAEHTWDNFVCHFTEVHQELVGLQSAAQQCGFVVNNVETTSTTEQTVQALEYLLQATTEDKMTVANLSTSNTNLTQQVANLTQNMSDKDRELSALKLSIDKLTDQLQKILRARHHAPLQHQETTPRIQAVVEGTTALDEVVALTVGEHSKLQVEAPS
eukprot:13093095-Ditylum_brightwellii.AAC.1